MAYTLLLADENQTIQRVVDLTFADGDVTVVAAGDGDAALASLDARSPDIVLADVRLPGKSGYDVASYVKHHPRLSHVPVLLMTGAFDPVDSTRAEASGYDGVLTKPLDPKGLVRRVKELLEKTALVVASPEPVAEEPIDAPVAEHAAPEDDLKPFTLEPITEVVPPDPWMRGFDESAATHEPAKADASWLDWLRVAPEVSAPERPDLDWFRPAPAIDPPAPQEAESEPRSWFITEPQQDEVAPSETATPVFELPAPETLEPTATEQAWFDPEPKPVLELPEPILTAPAPPEPSWFDIAPAEEEPAVFDLSEPGALSMELLNQEFIEAPAAESEQTEPPSAPLRSTSDVDTFFEELDLKISLLTASPRRLVSEPDPSAALPSAPAPQPIAGAPRSLANAFASLLAAEQGSGHDVQSSTFDGPGSGFEVPPSSVPGDYVEHVAHAQHVQQSSALLETPDAVAEPVAAPAITHEELLDRVAQLALDRMTGDEVRAIVEQVVTSAAEKLVREEIERIKSNIK